MGQERAMGDSRDWPMQVFYDGACPLCSREMAHYRKQDRRHRMEMVDIAAPGFEAGAYGLDAGKVQQMMHVRMADGRVFTQVRAFVKIWQATPTWWNALLRGLLKVPGVMWLAGVFYRWFARNRYRLTGRCTPESCGIDAKVKPES
jgi:predicted DCC family thiol-disulfide oxidoreductase YuxK